MLTPLSLSLCVHNAKSGEYLDKAGKITADKTKAHTFPTHRKAYNAIKRAGLIDDSAWLIHHARYVLKPMFSN